MCHSDPRQRREEESHFTYDTKDPSPAPGGVRVTLQTSATAPLGLQKKHHQTFVPPYKQGFCLALPKQVNLKVYTPGKI